MMNQTPNPANDPTPLPDTRIPMSVPSLKLNVPDIPGEHLHWMLGTPDRIAQAQRAGYRFVSREETFVNQRGVANGRDMDGNSDLGSQVSVIAGGDIDRGGQPVRLILMKLKQEHWLADQKLLEAQNDRVAEALRSGNAGATSDTDLSNRYVGKSNRNMFMKRST